MIKRNSLTIFLILITLCVKSQTSRLEFGVHGGINLGSLYGDGVNYYSYNQFKKNFVGGEAGLSFSYRFSKKYSLKTFVQFEQNAIILQDIPLQSRSGYAYGKGDEITKLSYLNVPVTCIRSFGKRIKLNVNGGVFFGYLTRESEITIVKQRYFPPGLPPTYEIFKNQKEFYKSKNFGLSFGAGVSYPISKTMKLDLNLQDCLGLYDVVKAEYSSRSSTKTNSLSLSTGVIFSL